MTPAMLDYKQCALSTSAVLAVEHTTLATAKGVARGEGREDGVRPLSLHSGSGGGSGWVGVVGPGRHSTDEKSPHGNG